MRDLRREAEKYAEEVAEKVDEKVPIPDKLKDIIVVGTTALPHFDREKEDERSMQKILRRNLRAYFSALNLSMNGAGILFFEEKHNHDTLEQSKGFFTAYASAGDHVVIWADLFKRFDARVYHVRLGLAWKPVMEAWKLSAEGLLAEERERVVKDLV